MINISEFANWTPTRSVIYGCRKSGKNYFYQMLRLEMLRQDFKARSKRLKRARLI